LKLSDPQRFAVQMPGNVSLEACPGSGKTRTLIAKLLRCVDELGSSTRKVACITHTNAAVHEIENRVGEYVDEEGESRVEIGTIHAFCLRNIISPYGWKIPGLADGFSVAAPQSDVFRGAANEIAAQFLLDPYSTCDALEHASRLPDGGVRVGRPLSPEHAAAFWEKLEQSGYLDFTSIVYHAFRLLSDEPEILRALQSKHAWMLVDEFQDTSPVQSEILKLIAAGGRTRFFFVGDVRQSILGFTGADPRLMGDFQRFVGASSAPPLADNYRSSEEIIRHAELLEPRADPMRAKGDNSKFGVIPQHVQAASNLSLVTDTFIPALEAHGIELGKAAVLAPTWFSLYPLASDLRSLRLPVVGPGARPYRRRHFYASLAEQLGAQAVSPTPDRVRKIERELFFLISDLTGEAPQSLFAFRGRLTIERLVRATFLPIGADEQAITWLERSVRGAARIIREDGWISVADEGRVVDSVADMIRDIESGRNEATTLRVSDLAFFADPENALRLINLHKAKGREFEAVLIIDLHEGVLPHRYSRTQEQIDEARRVLYVGVTRAKKLLFYGTTPGRARPSPLLGPGGLGLYPP